MKSYKVLLLLLLNIHLLWGNTSTYSQGLHYYESKQYTKAFQLIATDARQGHKASQYRLAHMYENGLGTTIDYKKSMYWYKQAASHYAAVVEEKEDRTLKTTKVASIKQQPSSSNFEKKSIQSTVLRENVGDEKSTKPFYTSLKTQFGKESFERGNEFLLAKMDTDTKETKKILHTFIEGNIFGLQAYNTNYILPFSYAKNKPKYHNSLLNSNNAYFDNIFYDKNAEVEFQISLKKQLSYNLFGWNEYLYAAYTQKVWWQLYADSSPFRETNYAPEIFLAVPTSQSIDDAIGLKMLNFGFIHESNGQDGYRSRSWNRLYLTGQWQWSNLFLKTRIWYRLAEDRKPDTYYNGSNISIFEANDPGDDNPDILDYMGYGDIKLNYLWGDHIFGLLLRNNFKFNGDNKGAVEFDWSYPLFESDNASFYVKVFHGYGESLISYDEEVTRAAFGFSFSPGLF